MSDNDTVDRRTLLKATGAALGATVLATGSASADHFGPYACVKLTHDYVSYTECSKENYGQEYERGTKGTVFDECESEYGWMAYFHPDDPSLATAWVSEDYLERC